MQQATIPKQLVVKYIKKTQSQQGNKEQEHKINSTGSLKELKYQHNTVRKHTSVPND